MSLIDLIRQWAPERVSPHVKYEKGVDEVVLSSSRIKMLSNKMQEAVSDTEFTSVELIAAFGLFYAEIIQNLPFAEGDK